MENLTQPFDDERQQTDNSLNAERGKTDESFDIHKEKAKLKTNDIVSDDRDEADVARAERRSKADSENNGASKQAIQGERKSEDSALKTERLKNDLAIEQERNEKEQLLNKLVSAEREATDKNLSKERQKTDHSSVNSTLLFDLECKAHLETKSALTTREEFIAIVSHDLRNPISAILSFSDVLLEDASIHEQAKKYIEIIKRNAETSLRLIRDILDMERIENGKIQIQLAPQNLTDIITECIDRFRLVASAKNINLKAEKIDLKSPVNCDRDRVVQIISNLICNALKFTPEKGVVTVNAEEADSEITVSIVDTGPGIPEDQKIRIFERFAQLGNKDRRGLGLGLYISKTLIESHNGKIWVTSEYGHGSAFCFRLPK